MKRNFVNGSILPVSAALALSLSFLAATPRAAEHRAVEPAWRDSIVSLRVQYQWDTVEITRRGDAWMISGLGLPADTARLTTGWLLLASLRAADSQRVIGRAPEEIGLDEVEGHNVRLKLRSGRTVSLRLGRAPENGITTYWTRAPSRDVFRTTSRAWSISGDKAWWLDKALVPAFNAGRDLKAVWVTWTDSAGTRHRYGLRKNSRGVFQLFGSDTSAAAAMPCHKAGGVTFNTTQFLIDGVPESGEPAASQSPAISVRLELESGRSYLLETIGESGPHYLARHPVHGKVVKVLRGRFDTFRRTLEDLGEPPVQGPAEAPATPQRTFVEVCPVADEEEQALFRDRGEIPDGLSQ